jgi:hypothetical protein
MAQEINNDSTKTGWSVWSYQHYRRLLDEEMMEVCRIYAEVELADLPVSKGKEAKGWLTSAHQEAERAREHIGERIKGLKTLQALLYHVPRDLSFRCQKYKTRSRAFRAAMGADQKPKDQAEEAAARARARAVGMPEGPQLAEEVDTGSEETESGRRRDSTCPRTPSRAEVDLVDSTSESDTSDPGGMPQLFRGAAGSSACPPRLMCTLPREPTNGEAGSEEAARDVERPPTADARGESPGRGLSQVAETRSSSTDEEDGSAQAPAPDQPPEGNGEFARELASAMSTIASLVIKASG